MAAPEFCAQMGDARARRAAADRHSRSPNCPIRRRKLRRSRWRFARRWKRRARRRRWSRPTGSSRGASRRCSRAGASRPTTAPASRCRRLPPGTLLLGIASAAAEELAPVAAAGAAQASAGRRRGRRAARVARCGARARPEAARAAAAGRARGARRAFRRAASQWQRVRPRDRSARWTACANPCRSRSSRDALSNAAQRLAGDAAWRGPCRAHGRGDCSLNSRRPQAAQRLMVAAARCRAAAPPAARRAVPCGRLMAGIRASSSGGLLEARLQRADLVVLGGLNEGVWPALPAPDPWLPPKVRATLGMPTLEFRIGLAAHDFASALGAPEVLITRARRDSRSPTVASRFWLRLRCDQRRLAARHPARAAHSRARRSGRAEAGRRPAPSPPREQRPERISVTAGRPAQGRSVRLLCAGDPEAAARSIRSTTTIPPAWKGTRFTRCCRNGCKQDECDPDKLRAARRATADKTKRSTRCCARCGRRGCSKRSTGSRSMERRESGATDGGRSRPKSTGEDVALAAIMVQGRADRIDRLADGGLAIIDYKTGQAANPEGGRRRLCASAWPAWPDRTSRRVRGRLRRPGSVRILVAGPISRQVRAIDARRTRICSRASSSTTPIGNFADAAAQVADGQRAVHRQAQPGLRALWRLRSADAA